MRAHAAQRGLARLAGVDGTQRELLLGGALAALVAVAFHPALSGGFVWDDVIFSEEPVLHAADGLWRIWFSPGDIKNEGHYWPLVYTTFWLEHQVWGLDPLPYKVTNLVLHAANAILVWQLARRLKLPGAWLLGAVFAVHPVHVESVAWMIERKDLLSGLFYLAAVLAWVAFAERRSRSMYLLAFAFFVAGLLSKSVVVTLPAALLVWHWWRAGRVTVGDVARLAPFFAVGLGIAWADYAFYASRESVDLGYSLAERTLIAARALWFYAAKLVWPLDQAVIYARWPVDAADPLAWLFVATAAALAALLWFARSAVGRGPLAGAVFFAVTLSPVLGFIDYGYMQFSFVADRFQYLAGLGLLAVFAAVVARGWALLPAAGRVAAGVLGCLCCTVLVVLTARQSAVYRDEVALFSHVVALNPTARDAHLNLGSALLEAGRVAEGMAASRIAAEQRPETAGPLANIGRGLLAEDRFEEAEAVLREAVGKEPRHLSAQQNLAEVYRHLGRTDDAEAAYRRVLGIDADYVLAHAGLGHMLNEAGRHEEALAHMDRVVALRPELPLVAALRVQMAQAARALGHLDAAEDHLHRAIALRPDHQEPLREMAELRAAQGRTDEAEAYRRRARDLLGNDPARLHAFAEAMRLERRLDDALGAYRKALRQDPDFAPAHAGLGLAEYAAERPAEALAALRRALELDPELAVAPSLHLYAGHALKELGRLEEAQAEYEAVLEAEPRNADALDHLALLRFGAARYADALDLYRTLADVKPQSAVTHSNLGAVLHRLGRNAEALASTERALELDPELQIAEDSRAAILAAMGGGP